MESGTAWLILILTFFPASSFAQQVVFSRRVYKEQGRSYQQIWTWNPADNSLKQLTDSVRDHYSPACAGGKMTFFSRDYAELWSFDPMSGQEHKIGLPQSESSQPPPTSRCAVSAKAGILEACGRGEDLLLSRAGKPIGQIHMGVCGDMLAPCEGPIRSLEWSPDGMWLVVQEPGLDDGSTSRQVDDYVVNPANMKLSNRIPAASEALWLPERDEIVYATPRDTAPLPGPGRERGVWVQHLMLFNPATDQITAITSGVSNNLDPAWCR